MSFQRPVFKEHDTAIEQTVLELPHYETVASGGSAVL